MTKSYTASAINDITKDKYARVILTTYDPNYKSFNSVLLLMFNSLTPTSDIPEDILTTNMIFIDSVEDCFSESYSCYCAETIELDQGSKEVLCTLLDDNNIHFYKVFTETNISEEPLVEIELICTNNPEETIISRTVQDSGIFIEIILPESGYKPFISTLEHPLYIIKTDAEEDSVKVLKSLMQRQNRLLETLR